jgi:hypothetical protein
MRDSLLIKQRVDFVLEVALFVDELLSTARKRAVLPEFFRWNVTFRDLVHPQKSRELFRVDTVVFLLLVGEPIRFQRIGERDVEMFVESVVNREVVTGGFERSFASSVLLSDLVEVRVLIIEISFENRGTSQPTSWRSSLAVSSIRRRL